MSFVFWPTSVQRPLWVTKAGIHLCSLYLLGQVYYLGYSDQLGADPVKAIIHYTGIGALNLLLLTLCITPIDRLMRASVTSDGWRKKYGSILRLRRMLGLHAFVWAVAHLGNYLVFDLQLDLALIANELVKRPYIIVGMLAWVILLVLAITSIPSMVRRLGRRWKALHRSIYIALIAACLHFAWSVKVVALEQWLYVVAAVVLLGARLPVAGSGEGRNLS